MIEIEIKSPAFEENAPIPTQYTGEGRDVSPPLEWGGLPGGVQQLALICDDPDAPRPEPWVHWLLYGLPGDSGGLGEGDSGGGAEGLNSWSEVGYRGPMPPPGHGVHHYHFKLYALDRALKIEAGIDKERLLDEIDGHVLGIGELIGTYER